MGTQQLTEENSQLKHEWLADQTQLVSSATDTEKIAETVSAWRKMIDRLPTVATEPAAAAAAASDAGCRSDQFRKIRTK